MSPRFFLRQLARESRGQGGRLAFFAACLAVGVAAVVAVAGLAASLDQAIRGEARQLLAADLAVDGRRPLPDSLNEVLAALPGARRTDLKEMVTVVAAPPVDGEPGPSRLVELKAVGAGYPFYGDLLLEPEAGGARAGLADRLGARGVAAAPDLFTSLGLSLGDTLLIGGEEFQLVARIANEPDRLAGAFSIGPRIFLSLDGLERSGLETFGSRIEYRALVRLDEAAGAPPLDEAVERIEAALPDEEFFRVETYKQAQPALRQGLERAERFLGLVALLSLLIGGIGVAQAVRAWLAGRLDAIAILKYLGTRPREIFALYLAQTAVLGIGGSVAGALAGTGLLALLPRLMSGVIPQGAITLWQPAAVLRGLGLGLGVSLLFSLPPLLALGRVPPVRVLRRLSEPVPPSRAATLLGGLGLLGGIVLLATVQSGSLVRGALFTGGLAVAGGLLALAARGLSRIAGGRRLRDRLTGAPFGLRSGIAALARPGAGTLGAIVALGLGVLVVLAMFLVESRLGRQLAADLPAEAPTVFLIDIQPAQWSEVRRTLVEAGAEGIDSVPVITARLDSIDGVAATELAARDGEERDRRWALTREQRLTTLRELAPDNEVVAGALWSDPERWELSVEVDFAETLELELGSELIFDVQGVPIPFTVTSLRTVDWEGFGINFFLVAEPGALDGAPQQRVATARLPEGSEQALQDRLVAQAPNVTVLNLREILAKIVTVLRRVGLGIRLVGGFTVLAGIAILAGAIGAANARRGREVALLKTLGMTRLGVLVVFAVEYALIGLCAGLIGTLGGGLLAWAVLTYGMDVPWSFEPLPYLAAILITVTLGTVAGLAASARALGRRPLEVLRQG